MGQKVSPVALRLGINRTWDSRWYAEKNEYPKLLMEDRKIRELEISERDGLRDLNQTRARVGHHNGVTVK